MEIGVIVDGQQGKGRSLEELIALERIGYQHCIVASARVDSSIGMMSFGMTTIPARAAFYLADILQYERETEKPVEKSCCRGYQGITQRQMNFLVGNGFMEEVGNQQYRLTEIARTASYILIDDKENDSKESLNESLQQAIQRLEKLSEKDLKFIDANPLTRWAYRMGRVGNAIASYGSKKNYRGIKSLGTTIMTPGFLLLWATDFAGATKSGYDRTWEHIREYGGLDSRYVRSAQDGAYCYRKGVELAVREAKKEGII